MATNGPVLELRAGNSSTPLIHWLSAPAKRKVVTYESDPRWLAIANEFREDWHDIRLVSNYAEAEIECPWDVAFVDQEPAESRVQTMKRLAPHAVFVVAHDAEEKHDSLYHYSEAYPLYKFKYLNDSWPKTVVLRNTVDVTNMRRYLFL